MSGIVSGVNYSLLFSPAGSLPSASAAILNALYNTAPTSTTGFASTGDPLLDLKLAQTDQTADTAKEAQVPQVAQAITAFTSAIKNATSIQSALGNPNVQQVLLTASGLSNYIGETGLVQKAFMSDPSDPNSLVNQLGDGTLLSTVQTYNFAQNGLAELQNPKIQATLTNGYAEIMWRQSLNTATPGLSNALDFISQASSITSVSDVLNNATNFFVITGALGIDPDIANQDLSAQQSAIAASSLDIPKLQNPAYVTSLTDQYLINQQESNQSSTNSSSIAGLLV
ncbi:MAG: DUF1217 domain-containing protein [Acetobacteraceae bacterium]|jgi:hypothetical protein